MPEKNKFITKEKVLEFLKVVKQCEYKIIEQLKKMPIRISLFSLIISFEPHW